MEITRTCKNQNVEKSVLVRKTISNLLDFLKILLGEKENIYNPSSSDNITKEVIFVNLVELQLFYANFEMKSIQLWGCIHPLKMLCCISEEDLDCAITPCLPSSSSSIYFPVPWLFFSILLLLQSTLHLHGIKNYKQTTETKKKRINSCKK